MVVWPKIAMVNCVRRARLMTSVDPKVDNRIVVSDFLPDLSVLLHEPSAEGGQGLRVGGGGGRVGQLAGAGVPGGLGVILAGGERCGRVGGGVAEFDGVTHGR